MPGEKEVFDVASAVDSISEGLGFGAESTEDRDISEGGEGHEGGGELENPGLASDPAAAGTVVAPPAEGAPPENPVEGAPAEGTPAAFTPSEEQKHLFNEDGTLRTWRKEAAAMFGTLPPAVQQEILKREEDIHRGIEGYKEAAAFGSSVRQALSPYLPILAQYNIDPGQQAARLFEVQHGLVFGTPEQKSAIVAQIAKDYGVDLAALGAQQVYVDPQVADLQNQIKSLQSRLEHDHSVQQQSQQAALKAHINTFASDPKNIYFEELANDMAHLLRTGAETTVEAAYEKAIWLNPTVRQKELARQQAEKASLEAKAAAEKLAAAKKATAANVRSKGKGGSAATPLGSMDDTLNEALIAIRNRSS